MSQNLINLSRFAFRQIHFLGAALLSMGLVMGLITEKWWPLPGSTILAGLLLIGLRFTIGIAKKGGFDPGNRRLLWQVGGAIGLAILLNSTIATYSSRIDLTENQLYTLSSQTQQILKSLKKPLKVWVFTASKTPGNDELLTTYRRYSSQFNYEFVDPQSAKAQKFNVQTAGEVYIESGETKTFLQSLYPNQQIKEVDLTAGIERNLNGLEQIAWLQGHGEPDPQSWGQAYRSIRNKNYRVQPLVLAQTPIPKETSLVAWIGAQKPLLPNELTALDRYLDKGGRLLLLAGPKAQLGADSLLQKWGITLEDRLVRSQSPDDGRIGKGAIVTDYGDHPIGQSFEQNISLYPEVRPVVAKAVNGKELVPILKTGSNSWSAPIDSAPQPFNSKTDRRGPLTLGVVVTANQSRLVVIGSDSFIQDGLFEKTLNGDVLLNSISWLSDRGTLAVRPKEITNRRIILPAWQVQTLFWLPVVIFPGASFSLAGWRWWQQR